MENCNAKAILAFDCSTPNASVALRLGDETHSTTIQKGRHAAELVASIDTLLANNACSYTDIAAIVTTIGPGSFTGLRIGLSVAHGLHLARGIPLKCTTGLAAIAHHLASPTLRAVMAVGKGEVAYQDFENSQAIGDIIRTAESDEALVTAPHLAGTYKHKNATYFDMIDASWLCDMADSLPLTPVDEAVPLYIRPPDAIIPQAPRWLAS